MASAAMPSGAPRKPKRRYLRYEGRGDPGVAMTAVAARSWQTDDR